MSITSEEAEALLKPYMDALEKLTSEKNFEELGKFYDKNAVVIESDKKIHFGREAIVEANKVANTEMGKCKLTMLNPKYEGVGDYLILSTDFELRPENSDVLKGHCLHIWRKYGDRYVIYHNEYSII